MGEGFLSNEENMVNDCVSPTVQESKREIMHLDNDYEEDGDVIV